MISHYSHSLVFQICQEVANLRFVCLWLQVAILPNMFNIGSVFISNTSSDVNQVHEHARRILYHIFLSADVFCFRKLFLNLDSRPNPIKICKISYVR